MSKKTLIKRNKIKKRIRKVVFGTKDKPRLTVFRSNKEIYAQLIDDSVSKTIVAASSKDKDLKLKTNNKIVCFIAYLHTRNVKTSILED